MENNVQVEYTLEDFKRKDAAERSFINYKAIALLQRNCDTNCDDFNKRLRKLENKRKIDLGAAFGSGGFGAAILLYLKTKIMGG